MVSVQVLPPEYRLLRVLVRAAVSAGVPDGYQGYRYPNCERADTSADDRRVQVHDCVGAAESDVQHADR